MAQPYENSPIEGAVELLKTNGFDALAEAVTVLLNTAIVAERSEYLGAAPYERSADRIGYANGYKDKHLKTRLGTLPLKVPQTREGEFYPQSLERGLRSERALLLAIAEMYVQGVSTHGSSGSSRSCAVWRSVPARCPGRRRLMTRWRPGAAGIWVPIVT